MAVIRECIAFVLGLTLGSGGGIYLASGGSFSGGDCKLVQSSLASPSSQAAPAPVLVSPNSQTAPTPAAAAQVAAAPAAMRSATNVSAGIGPAIPPGPLSASSLAAVALQLEPLFQEIKTQALHNRACGAGDGDNLPLLAAARHESVDVILESGTSVGRSTEIMARFLQHEGRGGQVITVDIGSAADVCGSSAKETHKRLMGQFNNVRGIIGDSFKIFPQLLSEHAGKRIGLFIDGPKGTPAAKLCIQSLRQSPDLKYCAFHDVRFQGSAAEGAAIAGLLSKWGRTVLMACCNDAYLKPMQLEKNKNSLGLVAGTQQYPLGVQGDNMRP